MVTTFTVAPTAATLGGNFTTARWNTYVRDNLQHLSSRASCRLVESGDNTGTGNLSVSASTWTQVRWWDDHWDADGMHTSGAVGGARIAPPVGCPTRSVMLVGATVVWERSISGGNRGIRIVDDAGFVWQYAFDRPANAGSRVVAHIVALVEVDPTGYVQVEVYHDAKAALDVMYGGDDDEAGSSAWAIYMGDAVASTESASWTGYITGDTIDGWWDREVTGSLTRLFRRPAVYAYRATGSRLSISDSTWTSLTLPSEEFDNDLLHSTLSNTERLTATRDGYYFIVGGVSLDDDDTGTIRSCRLRENGVATGMQGNSRPASANNHFQVCDVRSLVAGDYVDMQVYQDSGGAVDAWGRLSMVWIGGDEVAAAQRLDEGWLVDPYDAPASGQVDRSWLDIHTRDMGGLLSAPPVIVVRSDRSHEIDEGGWAPLKWDRQVIDTWDVLAGTRHAGEKLVVPVDGLYLAGVNCYLSDTRYDRVEIDADTKTFTVDTATDEATCTSHGYRSGTQVWLSSTTTIPAGLSTSTPFWVRRVTANTFTFHTSQAGAENNTGLVNITSTGSGTHRVSTSTLTATGVRLYTGLRVRVSSDGTLPAGLSGGTDYYVVHLGGDRYRLADSVAQAALGGYVVITDNGSGDHWLALQEPYGSRAMRIVHNGEVQGGWQGAPTEDFSVSHPAVVLLAARAEDEVWVEARTHAPEGGRARAALPGTRAWLVWVAPLQYEGTNVAPRVKDR